MTFIWNIFFGGSCLLAAAMFLIAIRKLRSPAASILLFTGLLPGAFGLWSLNCAAAEMGFDFHLESIGWLLASIALISAAIALIRFRKYFSVVALVNGVVCWFAYSMMLENL